MTIHMETSPGAAFWREGQSPAKILVAEDPFVSTFLRTVLQRHGDEVVTADVDTASQLMGAGRLQAEIVITNKPKAFLPIAHDIRMLYIASNPDPELAAQFPASCVLRKPFRNQDLLQAVEQLEQLDIR